MELDSWKLALKQKDAPSRERLDADYDQRVPHFVTAKSSGPLLIRGTKLADDFDTH
jgi:hypothetical protein